MKHGNIFSEFPFTQMQRQCATEVDEEGKVKKHAFCGGVCPSERDLWSTDPLVKVIGGIGKKLVK